MANYLYNGAELPDINAVWTDKETYPYAIIKKGTNFYVVTLLTGLVYCDTSTGLYGEKEEDTKYRSYYHGGAFQSWIFMSSGNVTGNAWGSEIWSNFDLYDTNGNLLLAASDPVPVSNPPAPDPFWMLMGWMVGRMIAGMRGKKQTAQPIAYLYNGVQLPALPEWDRESYPYAVIQTVNDTYRLVICMDVMSAEEAGVTVLQNSTIWNCRTYIMDTNSIEWVDNGVYHLSTNIALTGVFWTGTDILNTDGTLYLSASEPVPVYE